MVFEVRDLYKHFGTKQVLKGVSFSAKSGAALGLLGRNGAGKTTSIRIIMDVFPADGGQVLMDGAPFDRDKISIGYLPEEHGLYPKAVINDQLLYLAQLRGMNKKQGRASIARWMKRLGMGEYATKKLITLSKGNQQKIQLVAALLGEPEMVILDEPFSGLDPVNAALLKDVVKELIADGKIILFSSHQMNYVEEFCDSIAILHEGTIKLAGSISEIKRSYDRSVLVVRTGEPERLRDWCYAALADIATKAEVRANTAGNGNELLIHLKETSLKAPVMGRLPASGIDIDGVWVYEPTLNDIFVYTAGDEDEGAANETA